jgi:hypothetical protein
MAVLLASWGCVGWSATSEASVLDARATRDTVSPPLVQPVFEWRSAQGHLRRSGGPSAIAHTWGPLSTPQSCAPLPNISHVPAWRGYLEAVYGEPITAATEGAALQQLQMSNFFYYNGFPRSACIVEWLYGDNVAPGVAWRAAAMILPCARGSE